MDTLRKHISRRPTTDVVLIQPDGVFTAGDLLSLADAAMSRALDDLQTPVSTLDLIVTLIAYDGVAEQLEIKPADNERGCLVSALLADVPGTHFPTDTRWILWTSGTTGLPKRVDHSLRSLTSTTKRTTSHSEQLRWALLFSPARFAGLQVILQALIGGGVLIATHLHDLSAALRFFVSHSANAFSCTPSLWRKILMSPVADTIQPHQITLGGEIADQAIIDTLARRFPTSRITHIYASTEAGVGFAVHDRKAGFPRDYLDTSAGHGVRLRVLDDGSLGIHSDRSGRLEPSAGETPVSNDRYIDSGDLVRIVGDRVLFLGRKNRSINVGGNKVMPETVEAVLLQHDAVVAARVYGKPSALTGSLVAADIELKPGHTLANERHSILAACHNVLERWQVPALLHVVESIVIGPGGKVVRSSNA